MKTTYKVTPCYFQDKSDFITFKTGAGLSEFLLRTEYDCDVAISTDSSVISFNEYLYYGENNGPV